MSEKNWNNENGMETLEWGCVTMLLRVERWKRTAIHFLSGIISLNPSKIFTIVCAKCDWSTQQFYVK
jgi:hypothetical protein